MARIRRFKPTDAKACRRIVLANSEAEEKQFGKAFAEDFLRHNTTKRLIEKSKRTYFLVATISKRVVGMGRLYSDGAIGGVYLLPAFQRQGIGSQIMLALEKQAKKQGIRIVGLGATKASEKFYFKIGYKHTGTNTLHLGNKISRCKRFTKKLC